MEIKEALDIIIKELEDKSFEYMTQVFEYGVRIGDTTSQTMKNELQEEKEKASKNRDKCQQTIKLLKELL